MKLSHRTELFLLSVFILYLELLLIRWIGTEVSIFAYLQNAILICCFLGLGVGCLLRSKKLSMRPTFQYLALFSLLLSLPVLQRGMLSLAGVLSVLHDFAVWHEADISGRTTKLLLLLPALAVTFLLASFIWKLMVPLGSRLASLLHGDEKPVVAYSVNIAGSLVGIWIFGILSWFSWPPMVWIGVACLLACPLVLQDRDFKLPGWLLFVTTLSLPVIGALLDTKLETRWSPYQKLQISPSAEHPTEYEVTVNNSAFQQIQNNSAEYLQQRAQVDPELRERPGQYDLAGRLLPAAKEVLVVGAGTGNDVAGVLRTTDAQVTAVEIDPAVLDFGRRYHPEAPYSSPRVRFVVDDARAAFMSLPQKFDLIVFGLLDSHSTPALTNARLDHFVYTLESLAAARKLLKPDGIMFVMFQPQRAYVVYRLAQSLKTVFGKTPLTFSIPGDEMGWGGVGFISGSEESIRGALERDPGVRNYIEERAYPETTLTEVATALTTDNWPYLYLEKPTIPTLFVLLGLMLVALWFQSSVTLRAEGVQLSKISSKETLTFAAMGAAFSLFEVFGVNQCGILFGLSWIVNAIVISSILLMILLANLVQHRVLELMPRWLLFLLLVLVLVGISSLNVSNYIALPIEKKALFAAAIYGAPMFLSGLCFADLFEHTQDRGVALGANLFGALIGGALQLLTFLLGIKSLLLLAALFYLVAATCQRVSPAPRHSH